jgi:hypothetical protein
MKSSVGTRASRLTETATDLDLEITLAYLVHASTWLVENVGREFLQLPLRISKGGYTHNGYA